MLKAARKARRRWAWRNVAAITAGYQEGSDKRTKLGSQVKGWSSEELKEYRDSKGLGRRTGQTKSSVYRRMKRFLRNKKEELESKFKVQRLKLTFDEDDDLINAQDDRQEDSERREQQRQQRSSN